jgi:hypothetical protein
MVGTRPPQEYPNMPPFIRVVYPRFHQYTGHITIGAPPRLLK